MKVCVEVGGVRMWRRCARNVSMKVCVGVRGREGVAKVCWYLEGGCW